MKPGAGGTWDRVQPGAGRNLGGGVKSGRKSIVGEGETWERENPGAGWNLRRGENWGGENPGAG